MRNPSTGPSKAAQKDAVIRGSDDLRLIRLSPSARYALEGLVHLARSGGGFCLAHDVARERRLPHSFLGKIFQRLARAGLLRSQRGPGGGYSLARPPEKVFLGEIVSAVEPSSGERQCLLESVPCGDAPCALHEAALAADTALRGALWKLTLKDLVLREERA